MTVALRTLPRVAVTVEGRTLTGDLARSLASVRVQHRMSAPSLCELTFRQPPGLDTEPRELRPGAAITVTVEPEASAAAELFAGQLTAVELDYHADLGTTLRARAYDRLHQLRKHQPVRAHVDVTIESLAAELLTPLGLRLDLSNTGQDGPQLHWDRLFQHRQSDLALLAEVLDKSGLGFALDGDELRAFTYGGYGPSHRFTYGSNLREVRFEVNGEPACRDARAIGWNALTTASHEGTAGSPRSGRTAAAEAEPARFDADGARTLVGEPTDNDDHAAARAQRELDTRYASEVTLWAIADGDAGLRAGSQIDVDGVSHQVTGRYVLTEVDHVIDEHTGFVSRMATVPPQPIEPSMPSMPSMSAMPASLTVAEVTRVDDPEAVGRVKAALLAYDRLETEWMQVVCPGAGEGKGFVTLPDVGDRVAVLLDGGDPGRGVVIGGFYGMSRTDDSGVDDGEVRRYTWRTPDGQQLRLDRDGDRIRAENATGSYVELDDTHLTVHAATDVTIEAPGKTLTIRADRIDFRRG